MELKPGYKQTEVGVIPEEWKSSTVRGLASSARNAIVGGPFGSDLVSRDYVEHGVPVIRGQNMSGQWVSGTFVFVTPAKAKSLEANLARPGDIVFTQRGTLGQVSLVPGKPFESYLVSQSQMKLSVNREVADPLFFFYVFTSEKQQELISGGTIQTGVPHINLGILRDIPVQLPPLPEQRAIAGALSDVDELIGSLDQLIAKKRDLKQAAMQCLLTGQKRLPGFHGEWKVKRLGDVAHIKTGKKNNDDKEEDGIYPLFVRSQTVERINSYSYDCEAILVPGEGGIGSIFHYINGKFDCHQRVYKISAFSDETCGKFIFYCMTHGFHKQAKRNSVKATVDSLRLPTFKAFEFLAPELVEQTAIAEVLSDMDSELAALEQRRDKTRALKQGIMQELMTGRTRLV